MKKPIPDMDDFGSGEGPYSQEELLGIQRWLDEDWESHDQPRPMTTAMQRLLDTINHINMTERRR